MANNPAVPLNRIERVLAAMIASSAGLSILAIVATIVGGLARADLSTGAWPVVAVLPLVGLTLAFVLVIVFLVVSVVRRRRIARG